MTFGRLSIILSVVFLVAIVGPLVYEMIRWEMYRVSHGCEEVWLIGITCGSVHDEA
jgi:hypothetical protein